jgi:hypothetical protein
MPLKTPTADHVNPGFSLTKNTGRMIAAALIAPWATVLVSAIWAVWYSATTPRSTPESLVFPDPAAPWEFVFLYSIYGIPTAYLSLVFFLPIYSILCHLRLISYRTIIAVGLLVCVPAALFYGRSAGDDFRRILLFLLPYGAAVSACFLWITKQTQEHVTPRNYSS